jgi:hypothetical protein
MLASSYNGLLLGMRRLGLNLGLQAAQSVILWLGMYIGFQRGGPMGLVIGTAAANWAYYPVAFLTYRRLGLTNGWLDSGILLVSALSTFLVWRGYLGHW